MMKRLRSVLQFHFRTGAELSSGIDKIHVVLERMQESLGRIEARQCDKLSANDPTAHGFRVFSQWNEDGIIQFLIKAVPIAQQKFVEFGVQTYRESNTRFLLRNNNWSGLVLDANPRYIDAIKADPNYWQHDLTAATAFITRENINELLSRHGMSGELGLLSIDIDGNDYWIWEAIEIVQPAIVIVEYNAHFGQKRAVTVPYDPAFDRRRAHFSCIYYGASLAAVYGLGLKKGYGLIGCNSGGNNAFFVRDELLRATSLRALSPSEAFMAGKFREARNAERQLALMSPAQETELIRGLPVVDVETGATVPF
jgi:hypothetical protein